MTTDPTKPTHPQKYYVEGEARELRQDRFDFKDFFKRYSDSSEQKPKQGEDLPEVDPFTQGYLKLMFAIKIRDTPSAGARVETVSHRYRMGGEFIDISQTRLELTGRVNAEVEKRLRGTYALLEQHLRAEGFRKITPQYFNQVTITYGPLLSEVQVDAAVFIDADDLEGSLIPLAERSVYQLYQGDALVRAGIIEQEKVIPIEDFE